MFVYRCTDAPFTGELKKNFRISARNSGHGVNFRTTFKISGNFLPDDAQAAKSEIGASLGPSVVGGGAQNMVTSSVHPYAVKPENLMHSRHTQISGVFFSTHTHTHTQTRVEDSMHFKILSDADDN